MTPAVARRPSSRSTADDPAHVAALTEALAEHDEAILRAYVGDEAALSYPRLRRAAGGADTARASSIRCSSGPRGTGSASTACWPAVDELLDGARGDPDAPVSGRVFKIERTASGERVAYVRLFAGTLRPRQRVRVGGGEEAKPTSIRVFAPAGAPRRDAVAAGEMATIRGLGAVRVGDAIGDPPPGEAVTARFPRPTLEAVVFPRAPEQSGSLRAALTQLAEQDPLIDVRQDDHRHEISVSLYGEVQKEVIQATLERDYGIARRLPRDDGGVHRAAGAGRRGRGDHPGQDARRTSPAAARRSARTRSWPRWRCGSSRHRSDPASSSGPTSTSALVPLYLFNTVDAFETQMATYVREALERGPRRLAGDRLPGHDDRLRLRRARDERGRLPPADPARPGDGAGARRHVGLRAARGARAGDARPRPRRASSPRSVGSAAASAASSPRTACRRVDAVLPVARVRGLQHQLPGLSMGEGILETRFGGYQPIGENPPKRPRSGPEPPRSRRLARLAGEAGLRAAVPDLRGVVRRIRLSA